MATSTNKNPIADNDWLNQINKDAWETLRKPTPKEFRGLKRKRAFYAFLKRAYLFMLTACLM